LNTTNATKRNPEQLPDPWLFDSEALLRELDRCRQLVLQIPATTNDGHFASNIAIDAIWNLQKHLRYLLHLHREGQRQFAKKRITEKAPKPVQKSQRKSKQSGRSNAA
jgi:hypothetical protein